MSNCCDIANPLIRDGVSQQQRKTAALSPDFVQVDERDGKTFKAFFVIAPDGLCYYFHQLTAS